MDDNTTKTDADTTSQGTKQFEPKAFSEGQAPSGGQTDDNDLSVRTASDLETVFDVPIKVTAILGRAKMPVGDLLNLQTGSILELDRKVGEAIDILVNDKLIARGEVVMVENRLGITMTEIVAAD